MKSLLMAVIVLSAWTSSAHSWRAKGHEIVAEIAELHLTDAARKQIKELLPRGTTLAQASTWPDQTGARSLT